MSHKQAFLQCPGATVLRSTLPLALGFMVFFFLCYGAAAGLAEYIPWRHSIGFEWEKSIPFLPWTAYFYLSLNAMMWLSLFVFRDRKSILLLIQVLSLQVLIACSCYLLYPVENNFPPRYGLSELPTVFILADTVNMMNNECPSLHVCFAVTLAIAFATMTPYFWLRVFFALWAAAIAISTLTMHEHNLLDVLGGVVLAFWGIRRWQCMRQKAMSATSF